MPGRARNADHTPQTTREHLRDEHTKGTGAERGWWEGAKETSPLLPDLPPTPPPEGEEEKGGEDGGRERNPE